ncbi:isochorismatase family protein [Streptomyces sp. CBMA152]|uniref:isochorismatase family protein n=1 Tax=Streptomyces sp. CBMA152 TaxID=1896312 RepID=UPI00166070AA|nr:isochorismatase family protein [Streptomyces sp. CBMA152]MBD0741872.1 isochorismatase [Streptomyces sp. CBMA152]
MALPAIQSYPPPSGAELPENQVTWRIDPDRAVLLVHDMQRYFVDAFPAGQEPALSLTANVRALRDSAAANGMPVAYTAQPGGMTAPERGLLNDFWGPGMTVSREQRAVVDGIEPRPGDWVFTKWRYSAFHRTGLLDLLREQGRDQLVICGIYAHIGCLATAVESYTNDIETFMVSDAVADFTAEYHHMALRYAAERCAVVLPTHTAVSQITTAMAATTPSSTAISVETR